MEKVKHLVFFCSIYLLAIQAFSDINPQFSAHRHYTNPRFSGLSNAGVAIPEAVTSVLVNPALIHTWHWQNKCTYSATAGYARDSLFSQHVINTGASWQINEVTSIGSLYRNLKKGDDNIQNDIILCVAGRLFDKSMEQGAVNLGMNMRIERSEWESGIRDSLSVKARIYNDSQFVDTVITVLKYPSPFSDRSVKETRLLFDLGFFQDNILPGMDFGITFHNLFTRRWKSEKPSVTHAYDTIPLIVPLDSLIDTLYDTTKHSATWKDSKGRDPKVYKRMTVGIAYHAPILQNKVTIVLPLDIEFLGLFDRKQDGKVGLHTGIEAWLNNKICLRFGYAYAPTHIAGDPGDITFKSSHILSGGASVHFEKVRFEIYIKKQDWGIGSVVTF